MEHLTQTVEALIFAATSPISVDEIQLTLEKHLEVKVAEADILQSVEVLRDRYSQEMYAFELSEIAGGLQFLSKGAYFEVISTYLRMSARKRLSRAALETLSIIAYKQPVSKSEIETIRGVGCDYSIHKLLDKELIEITGRAEGPGRPLLYGTSEKFMDYFGLKSLNELPKLKEFESEENTIGEEPKIEEAVNQ